MNSDMICIDHDILVKLKSLAYPERPTSYPERPTSYPERPTSYPVAPTSYPDYPTRIPQCPTRIPQCPTRIPHCPTSYPVAPTIIPVTPTSYPEESTGCPVDTSTYPPTSEQTILQMIKDYYPEFIIKLGNNIKDPKFISAIRSLSNLRKINYKDLEVPVSILIPTQNEIVLANSLFYPLTDRFTAELILNGGTVPILGQKIVTSNHGRFIIDGHHRWSEVYCLNPSAKILSLDLSDVTDPFDALKYTQLGIAAVTGKTPISHGGGTNMLIACKKDIFKYISDNIKPDVVELFVNKHIIKDSNVYQEKVLQIQEYIWSNISRMRMYNKPITNAPSREIMPQTDGAPNWMQNIPFV